MKRILTALALAALLAATPAAQTSITIQPSTVAQIANGTITAGTTTLPSCALLDIRLNITATGTATGLLQLFIEDSTDGGTTWNDLVASNTFAFGAAVTTQRFQTYAYADGPGLVRSIAGAQPAAGAEISETVPAGARWELLAFSYTFTTSATVANRAVLMSLDDGTTIYSRTSFNVNHAASLAWNYELMQGYGTSVISQILALQAPIPINNRLQAGHRIRTVTGNIQVGDQFSAIQYLVREWRDVGGSALQQETAPAGFVRTGAWGDRLRVREKVSGVAGGPVGPTYTITAACKP